MTEFELIERYFNQQYLNQQQDDSQSAEQAVITKGLGDDAAVVTLSGSVNQWVTCVDTLIQGRHFSESWDQVSTLAFAIGYKSVAVNVSDIAAMGATPHSILLALALPERLAHQEWLSEFAKGLFHACTQYGVRLIGGDTTRNDKLVISITANGMMAKGVSPIYRYGAQVGDKIYLSGTVGDASYALYHPDNEVGQHLAHRLHMPTPRVKLGKSLSSLYQATSMIDISDGLVQDLGHICQQSRVAMRVDLETLPASEPLQQIEISERLRCQLTGGDDYELAFTLPASVNLSDEFMDSVNTQITCIGEVIACEGTLQNSRQTPVAPTSDTLVNPSINQLVKLVYQGHEVTQENPYPFVHVPDLSGYQHFTYPQS